MKIGLLGGSFDPIHNGHLYMAKQVLQSQIVDEIWFIPTGHSPNKKESDMASAMHRLHMCELATQNEPRYKVCDLEIISTERSYTYRTLEKLHEQDNHNEYYFIMGADSLDYFDCWVKPERICELAKLLVIARKGFNSNELEQKKKKLQAQFPCDIRILPCETYDAASREIRQSIRQNENVSALLPAEVISYIEQEKLYQM